MVADGRYNIRVPSGGTLGYYVLTAQVRAGQLTYWSTVSAEKATPEHPATIYVATQDSLAQSGERFLAELEAYLTTARHTAGLCRVSVGFTPLDGHPVAHVLDGAA